MVGEIETARDTVTLETALPASWQRLIASIGLILAAALQAADYAIVTVALPQLERDLGAGIDLGTWVIVGYLSAAAVTAPLTGWLRRRYGARRLFPRVIAGFTVASLLCAFAPSTGAIILFRILQGAAGGVIHPLVQAILLDIYPKERHGRIVGILSAGLMGGLILGPPLGGFITDAASWRWVFLINLPLGGIAIACVWRLQMAIETNRDRAVDVLGILLLATGVAGLQLFLARGMARSWFHSPEIVVEASAAVLAFALLAVRAGGSGLTAFRAEVFADVNFVMAAFHQFMLSALLFVAVIFLPLLAEGPLGLPATVGGSLIIPRAVLLMLVMLFVGRLIGRVDYRILLGGGWLLMAGGLFALSAVAPPNATAWIVGGSSIQSVGAGILYVPLVTLAYSTLSPDLRTDAAGLYILLRQLGYASGVALMSAVLQAKIAMHMAVLGVAADAPAAAGLVELAERRAYTDCFRMMAVVAIMIIPAVFLFRLGKPGRRKRAD